MNDSVKAIVPPKNDPRWRALVVSESIPQIQALPTKMLLVRIRLLAKDRTPQKIEEAIDIAYDFFSKNAEVIKNDIHLIFGG